MSKLIKIGLPGLIVIIVILWTATGFYTLKTGEEAVQLRFGSYVSTILAPGIHFHLPYPVETVWKSNVSEVNRMEYGFRTTKTGSTTSNAQYQVLPKEASMLTGDQNIVNVETSIQYKISDVKDFLFKVDDPYSTLRAAGVAAIRRVVASHTMDDVLTNNKQLIQQQIQQYLQDTVEKYQLGVRITAVQLQDVYPPKEVNAAFLDVTAAKEDANSYINEAKKTSNTEIPAAQGDSAKMINEAQAYQEQRTKEAQGDVAKFNEIYKQYTLGKEVTRTRMYLETMEQILPNVEKYIVNKDGNTVQFLPLGADKGIVTNQGGGK